MESGKEKPTHIIDGLTVQNQPSLANSADSSPNPEQTSRLAMLWHDLTEFGLAETSLRWLSHIILLVFIGLTIWAIPGITTSLFFRIDSPPAYAAPLGTSTLSPPLKFQQPSPASCSFTPLSPVAPAST